jgi:hypothetical protein
MRKFLYNFYTSKITVKCLLNILFCSITVFSLTLHIIKDYFANCFNFYVIKTAGKNINCWYFKVKELSKIFQPKNKLCLFGLLTGMLHLWATCVAYAVLPDGAQIHHYRHVLQISTTLHNIKKRGKGSREWKFVEVLHMFINYFQ